MFRAFDAKINWPSPSSELYDAGLAIWEDSAAQVRTKLKTFLRSDGSLDGSEMQQNWFPQVGADVFISHSHQDQRLAIALAGWLSNTFGLRPFIDSCVWGNADELLKIIDDEHCRDDPAKALYSYEKRNRSTSHVHMMLATALTMMIDNTECAWILNTQKSITTESVIQRTHSPWIFSEIATMRLVRRKNPTAHRERVKLAKSVLLGRTANFDINISYLTPLDSFAQLDTSILREWASTPDVGHSLDRLYALVPEPSSTESIEHSPAGIQPLRRR